MQKVYKALFGREYNLKTAVVYDVATEGLEHASLNSTGVLEVSNTLVYLEELNKRTNYLLEDNWLELCEF